MEHQNTADPRPSAKLAKLSRPWLPAVLPRERLFDRLDQLRDRTCTWIGAPAGFGKTVLAASYVESRGYSHLWYQFDEDDADLATFFYHLGIAAAEHSSGPSLPLLTPEFRGDVATFTRRYVQILCERLDPPFIFLFDNYHRLAPELPFHVMLAEALFQLPAGVRCLVTSRGEPPPALARTRLHGQLAVVDADALRLSLQESEDIARLQSEDPLSNDQVRSLHERAQGWVAGLTLLLQSVRGNPSPPQQSTGEILFDYFAEEVFRQADPAEQSFLLKTALLPKMTATMAGRMTGGAGAETLLDTLVRRQYFILRSEADQPNYQYHDLFRAFLLKLGRERLNPLQLEQDQRLAAAILEAAGETSAAVELWRALGEWERIGDIVSRQAETLLRQGRGQLLESWITAFPPEVLNRSPWLLFWLGLCQLPRDAISARSTLTRAYRLFERNGEATGLWLAWSAITETYILAWDDSDASKGWLAEFERLRTSYPDFGADVIEARATCGVFNLLILARPDHPEFPAWEARINRLLQGDAPPDLYLLTLNNVLSHFIWTVGRRGKAAFALSTLRAAHAQATQTEPVLRCALRIWEFSFQYWFEGDLERCLELAESAVRTSAELGIGLFNSLALSAAVYTHLSAGNAKAGRAALDRLERVLHTFSPVEHGHYAFLGAWEAWLSRRRSEACDTLERSTQIARRTTFYQPLGLNALALAQIRAGLGERAAALRHLADMRPWIRKTHCQNGAFLRALVLAHFALTWGRRERALGLLRRALALGREEGFAFFPVFKPDDLVRLCATALDAGIEVEYVQTLIRKRELLPDPEIVTSARWPWPVRLNVLGSFRIEVDGNPVTFGRKAQRKPLELLKALIAFGGRDIHQSRIADALWPDSDGDMAQQALATTLHRLRHLLGYKEALSLSDGHLSLNPRYCWVDAWKLESHIGEARAHLSHTGEIFATAELENLTRALVQSYPGPFLGRESATWAFRARERLHEKYQQCVNRLGAAWETHGNRALARACQEKARTADAEFRWVRLF